jgi:hypothetical protein
MTVFIEPLRLLSLLILIALPGCQNNLKSQRIDKQVDSIVFIDMDVDVTQNMIEEEKEDPLEVWPPLELSEQEYNRLIQRLLSRKQHIIDDSLEPEMARKLLLQSMEDSIFPAWYGTIWDFNGYTNIPRKGVIACGYFISTTLRHLGFNLNRYIIAQQDAATIVCSLCDQETIELKYSLDSVAEYFKKHGDGLYIVGLSCHVGFVYVEQGNPFFIHSDYAEKVMVMRQEYDRSQAFLSQQYVLGRLDTDKVLQKWLAGEEFAVDKCL